MKKGLVLLLTFTIFNQAHAQFGIGLGIGSNKTYITEQFPAVKYEPLWGLDINIPVEYRIAAQWLLIGELTLLQSTTQRSYFAGEPDFNFNGKVNDYFIQSSIGINVNSGYNPFTFFLQTEIFGGMMAGTSANGFQTWQHWEMGEFEGYDTISYKGWQNNGKYYSYHSPIFNFGIRPSFGCNYNLNHSVYSICLADNIWLNSEDWFFINNELEKHRNNILITLQFIHQFNRNKKLNIPYFPPWSIKV